MLTVAIGVRSSNTETFNQLEVSALHLVLVINHQYGAVRQNAVLTCPYVIDVVCGWLTVASQWLVAIVSSLWY